MVEWRAKGGRWLHQVGGITRACSRRSRLSRRLLAQAPRQPSSLLKHVVSMTRVLHRRERL